MKNKQPDRLPKTAPTMAAAAGHLGIDPEVIRSAKRSGCPAFKASGRVDLVALRQWLREQTKRARPRQASPAAPTVRGLAAALRRLESAEAEAFDRLQGCISGPGESSARKAWLSTAEALRRLDLATEAARRDAGELLPRSVAEDVLRHVGWALSVSSPALGLKQAC